MLWRPRLLNAVARGPPAIFPDAPVVHPLDAGAAYAGSVAARRIASILSSRTELGTCSSVSTKRLPAGQRRRLLFNALAS